MPIQQSKYRKKIGFTCLNEKNGTKTTGTIANW